MPFKDPEKRLQWRAANRDKVRKSAQRYYQAHKDETRIRFKRWYEKNTERQKASVKAWAKAHPERIRGASRRSHLRRKYGLTQEQYQDMVEVQGGRCALCERTAPLVVDHDHTTSMPRALLCATCNQGLGLFGELPDVLERAATYLRCWHMRHRAPHERTSA